MHSERLPLVKGGQGRSVGSLVASAELFLICLAVAAIWATVSVALGRLH
jgi:hypothetical protein